MENIIKFCTSFFIHANKIRLFIELRIFFFTGTKSRQSSSITDHLIRCFLSLLPSKYSIHNRFVDG